MNIRLVNCLQERDSGGGQLTGNMFTSRKRESDNITFSSIATRTNLFPKYSLTLSEGEMESIVLESVSSNAPPQFLVYIGIGKGRLFTCTKLKVKLLRLV